MSKKIPFVTKEQLEKIVSQYPTPFHLYCLLYTSDAADEL